MAETVFDRAAFPVFFIGSLLMTLPAIVRYYYSTFPEAVVFWSVLIGFILFGISLISGIFIRKSH